MGIHPSQILFYAGGRSLELFGPPSRRTAPIARRGEDIIETFSRASTGSYVDAKGEVKLAESAVQRIEMADIVTAGVFDTPTFLLEKRRTNGVIRAAEFDNASWTKTRASVSANADTAPDGATVADRLIEDSTASATHFTRQDITITADGNVVWSVFAKAGTRSMIALRIEDTTAADTVTTWFNLSTGAKGTEGTVTGTGAHARSFIEALGNGWYRCVIVGNIGGGVTTGRLRLFLATVDAQTGYSGDGSSYVILWGAQGEVNVPFHSSYNATVGSTVAGSHEQMHYTFTARPQAMTAYLRFVERGNIIASTTARLLHIGSGTQGATPRFEIQESGGFYRVRHDNGTIVNVKNLAAAPAFGDTVELVGQLNANGSIKIIQSINGAAATEQEQTTAATLAAAWAGTEIWINSVATSSPGFAKYLDVAVFAGVHSLADCRKATQQ